LTYTERHSNEVKMLDKPWVYLRVTTRLDGEEYAAI
jgi:hypothetical protein